MQYDPIKRVIGNVVSTNVFLRKTFYRLLDLLLLRAWHVKKALREFKSNAVKPLSILDAGMGFGQYTWFLAKLFPETNILAIDVKEEQVADCNNFFSKLNLSNRVTCKVDDLVVYRKENAFDLILCVDVMEHILEDEQVFSNYAVSLKKGGMLLISTPSDQGGSDVHGSDESSFIEEHVRDGYNAGDIREKLLRAGFSKAIVQYTYGKPGSIAWRLSMKIPIVLLGKSKAFFILLPFYYLLVYPFCYALNYADTRGIHPTGTGLIVKAWK